MRTMTAAVRRELGWAYQTDNDQRPAVSVAPACAICVRLAFQSRGLHRWLWAQMPSSRPVPFLHVPAPASTPRGHLVGSVLDSSDSLPIPPRVQSLNLCCRLHALRRTIRTGSKAVRASSPNAGRPSRSATTFARS